MNHLEARPFERVVAGVSGCLGEAERLHKTYSSLNSVDFRGVDFWQNQDQIVIELILARGDLESIPEGVKGDLFDYWGLDTNHPIRSILNLSWDSLSWTVEPVESGASIGCGFTIESENIEAYLMCDSRFFEQLTEGLKWIDRVIESRRLEPLAD